MTRTRPALLLAVALLGGCGAARGAAPVRPRQDSLTARVAELEGAIRQYILAADRYATEARNAEALLNWYRHQPTRKDCSR